MYRNRVPKKKPRQAPVVITSTPISPVPDEQPITASDDELDENVHRNKSVRKRKSSENETNRSTHSRGKLSLSTTNPGKSATKRARKVSETEDIFGTSFAASTIAAESPEKNRTTVSNASTSKSKPPASRSTRSKQLIAESPTKSRSAKATSSKSTPCYTNAGFISVLNKCGFKLGEDDDPNFLDKNQVSFVQILETQFKKDATFPANVDKFVLEFTDFIKASLQNLSRVMENTKSDDDLGRKSVQESLLRLLLNVDCVQPKLWKILFDVLDDLIADEDDDETSFALVHRMIRQLRCQDRIVQGDVNICDKLIGLVELSNNIETQREVILLMPDIIHDDDHEKAAKELSNNLTANQALIPARLDTLANLSLSDDLRKTVLDNVVAIMDKAATCYFQVIMKFLISMAEDVEPLVRGIRHNINLDPTANFNDGNEGLIFANTLKEREKPKKLLETWIDMIDQSEGKKWLAVDLLAMLVFYSFRFDKMKPLVLAAFKSHARSGPRAETDIVKIYPLVKSVIQTYYLDSLLEVIECLFKSKHVEESQYASFWYCLLFVKIDLSHESQKVLEQVLIHIGNGNPSQVSLAMRTLTEAANQKRDKMVCHSTRIETLLYDIESWEMSQVRQLMVLLFQLHYGPDAAQNVLLGAPDQIMIKIKKFLNQSSFSWRSKGIVGMVCAIVYMPEARAVAEFTKLMDLMGGFSNEVIGLLYDELALSCEDFSAEVAEAVRDRIVSSFEDTYVTDITEENKTRLSYMVEGVDLDIENKIVIPLIPEFASTNNFQVMCSQLRLTLKLHQSMGLDMTDIGAVLTTPVILPEIDEDTFNLLDSSEKAAVMDAMFYGVNLFRELVNGFSSSKNFSVLVLKRLEQMIKLTGEIAKYLAFVGDYTPPQCQFYRVAKSPVVKKPKMKGKGKKAAKGKGKGKGKNGHRTSNESLHNSSKDDDNDSFDEGKPAPLTKAVDMTQYSGFFRELLTSVVVLVSSPIDFSLTDSYSRSAKDLVLSPMVLNFLLTDYLSKLEGLFTKKPNPFGREVVNSNSLNQVDTTKSAQYCTKFVQILVKRLDETGLYCTELIEECDGVLDALGMFKAGSANVKQCHTLLLQCLFALVSWTGFQSPQNVDMKKVLLEKLVIVKEKEAVNDYVNEAFKQFANRSEAVLHLPGAVTLLKMIQKILAFGGPVTARKTKVIHDKSHGYLTRCWTDMRGVPETGAAYNANIEALFAIYMATLPAADRMQQVTELIRNVETEALSLTKKDDCLVSFVAISKSNFHIVFKALCVSLCEVTKLAKTLTEWMALVEALGSMSEMLQHLQIRQNLREYAKLSVTFFTTFLNKGMDVLNKNIMTKTMQVQQVFKLFQSNSRVLNRWIVDVRAKKDSNLIAFTPTLRKLMDRIILRVKAILLPFPESFSVGNLKTRNLAGDEILTQQELDEAEEEVPAEDDDDNLEDITLISDDDEENQGSDKDDDDASSTRSGSF